MPEVLLRLEMKKIVLKLAIPTYVINVKSPEYVEVEVVGRLWKLQSPSLKNKYVHFYGTLVEFFLT